MVELRRKEVFSFIWEHDIMTMMDALENIEDIEESFLEVYGDEDLPEWMLRFEAQDEFLKHMHKSFKEEDLI